MWIDAHHHVWDLAVRPQPWTDPFPVLARTYRLEDLQSALTACEITATVVVQTVTVPDETPELLLLADENPIVAGVVGWADIAAPDVHEQLCSLQAGPGGSFLVGLRHQVQDEPGVSWFRQPSVREGLRALAAHSLTYDLILRSDQLRSAIGLVEAIPELNFVLDHGGNPDIAHNEFESWRRDIAELAALPNITVKLSGLVTRAAEAWTVEELRPYADCLLTEFGPSRVLFGSDWPVSLLRCDYRQVVEITQELTGGLGALEQHAVFGENSVRWYGLETAR